MSKGHFVWFDAVTPDAARTVAFYQQLFGWTASKQRFGEMEYDVFAAAGRPLAGAMKPAMDGVPPHWLSYLAVDDVDATVRYTEAHGGRTLVPPFAIPTVGRAAIVADAQGAVFAPFREEVAMPPPPPAPYTFCWNELMVRDPEPAKRYYSELAGWTYRAMDMGPAGTYHVGSLGEQGIAGIMAFPRGAPEIACWMPYVSVPDVDATTAKARSLGGSVPMGPRDIPDVGRFSVLADPLGAAIALLTPKV